MERTNVAWLSGFVVLALVGTACTEGVVDDKSEGNAATEPPLIDGKADRSLTSFVQGGALSPGEPLSGEVTRATQYLGYTFYGREGELVSVALTSPVAIDTVLYVYGPFRNGSWGPRPIATNDDSGSSRLSRLDDLRLPASGQYLAVVMAYRNRTVGAFSITRECRAACDFAPRARDLRVVEVHPAPQSERGDANRNGRVEAFNDEFVEIRNVAALPVSLRGVSFVRKSAEGAKTIVHEFQSTRLLQPGQAALIFGGPPSDPSGFGNAIIEKSARRLALPNRAGTLALEFAGSVLDEASYNVPQPPIGSLVRVDDAADGHQTWVSHLELTSGSAPFSPGVAPDGSPYASATAATSAAIAGGDDEIDDLRASIESEVLRRYGAQVRVDVNRTNFAWHPVTDKQVVRALSGFLRLLDQLRAPSFVGVTTLKFWRASSSVSQDAGGARRIALDYLDDPRSHAAFLSSNPAEEPALAAFKADAETATRKTSPVIATVEPGLIAFLANPTSDPAPLFAAAHVTLTSVTRSTDTYGTTNQYRTDTIVLSLGHRFPSRIKLRLQYKASSSDIDTYAISYEEESLRGFANKVRFVYLTSDRKVSHAENFIYDTASGKLLTRTFVDELGNTERVVDVNPPLLPREEISVDDSRDADPLFDSIWARLVEKARVTVGIFDCGIDYNHPALAHRLLYNRAEGSRADGADADGNGFVDDFVGWDFDDGDRLPYDYNDFLFNYTETFDHGTHVAGISARGAAGIDLLPVRFKVDAEKLAAAAAYMRARGARVVNMSFGQAYRAPYDKLGEAIRAATEVLFVAAAGNDGNDNDATPHFPSGYPHPNLISVAATNDRGELTSWSNYGKTTVDVAAPGDAIESTVVGGEYGRKSGTSMAAPYVANIAAKVLLVSPSLTPVEVAKVIFETVDKRADLATKVATSGVVNADRAIRVAYLTGVSVQGGSLVDAANELGVGAAEAERLVEIASRIR